jgi:hypothetical protein
MAAWKKPLKVHDGIAPAVAIPAGLSRVPFVWDYLGTKLPMQFVAGFVGVAQDEDTLAVRPAIGWAVGDAKPVPASPEDRADDDFSEPEPIASAD